MVSVIRSDLAFLWKFKTFQLVLSSLVYAEQVSNGLIDDLHLLTFNNDISWSTASLLIGRHMISGAEQFHTWTCAIFMGCIFVLFYMWVLISLSFIVVVFFPCDLRLNISIVWFVRVSVRFYQGDLYKHTHFSYLKFFFHQLIIGMKYSCITNLTKIKEYTII